jgi:hypothetical protein
MVSVEYTKDMVCSHASELCGPSYTYVTRYHVLLFILSSSYLALPASIHVDASQLEELNLFLLFTANTVSVDEHSNFKSCPSILLPKLILPSPAYMYVWTL